jgi:hypothetical protein
LFRDICQRSARAVPRKRRLLGIFLPAASLLGQENSCGAAAHRRRFCSSRLRQGARSLHVAITRQTAKENVMSKFIIEEQTDSRIIVTVEYAGKRWEIDVQAACSGGS